MNDEIDSGNWSGEAMVLFDVTRLVDRMLKNRALGDIDRLGLAYLKRYGAGAQALVRYGWRWVVFDSKRSQQLFAALNGTGPVSARTVRQWVAQNWLTSWSRLRGAWLFNIGYGGLDEAGYVREIVRRNLRAVFFMQDMIPLCWPEYFRPGEVRKQQRRLETMLECGDALIINSEATRSDLARWASDAGRALPRHIVAPLVPDRLPAPGAPPEGGAYFVATGPIEPRRNTLLLLQVWRELARSGAGAVPRLVLLGPRGRGSEEAADLLDRCPWLRPLVREIPECSDAERAAWLAHARALLLPLFAEACAAPVLEAIRLDVPVVASDLPVFREMAGDIPHYLHPLDGPGWKQAVLDLSAPDNEMALGQRARRAGFVQPDWATHFRHVDRLLAGLRSARRGS